MNGIWLNHENQGMKHETSVMINWVSIFWTPCAPHDWLATLWLCPRDPGAALLRCNIGINDHHGAPMTRQVPNSSPGSLITAQSKGLRQRLKECLCFFIFLDQNSALSQHQISSLLTLSALSMPKVSDRRSFNILCLVLPEKVSSTALQRTCCRYLDDKPPIINISKLPIV